MVSKTLELVLLIMCAFNATSFAWMEMTLCLANFVNRLDMTLYETNEHTVQWRDNAIMVLEGPVRVTVDKIRK